MLVFIALLALSASMVSVKAQESCITSPQNDTCVNFTFPASLNIVTDFCEAMDNMPGCTIYHICENAAHNTSTGNDGVCSIFSLAQDLCFDMPSMDSQTCGQLASMCSSGSVVEECQTRNLTSTMPTFSQLTTALRQVCSLSPQPSAELCSRCSASNGWNCDLLGTFTGICAVQPNLTECSITEAFCANISTYDWPLCIANPPAAPTAPGGMHMPGMHMPGMHMPEMNMPAGTPATPETPTPTAVPTPNAGSFATASSLLFVVIGLSCLSFL